MAAAAVLRRCLRLRLCSSSSSSAPIRAHGGRLFSAFSSPLLFSKRTQPLGLSLRFFSSAISRQSASKAIAADEKLARVLDSEINCALEADPNDQGVDAPDDFPFEIVDNPGDQVVILKRNFHGEDIQVTVMLDFNEEEDVNESDADDTNDDNSGTSMDANITLVTTIDKGSGCFLEFCCSLNSDELKIESMVSKKSDNPDEENRYQGPEFS